MVDLSSLLDLEDKNIKGPTFKKMLLVQVNRLSKSDDPLDQQLRSHLISIIKEKGDSQESWIAEIEAVEQIHRLIKKGQSVESAVAVVAKQSNYSESILQTKYDEYKDALTEIEQIFTKPKTKDPE